jgi:hypothetical protein
MVTLAPQQWAKTWDIAIVSVCGLEKQRSEVEFLIGGFVHERQLRSSTALARISKTGHIRDGVASQRQIQIKNGISSRSLMPIKS